VHLRLAGLRSGTPRQPPIRPIIAAVSVLEESDVGTGEEFGRSRQRVLLILRVDVVERRLSH
jgi:hypothetical protein